MYSSRAVRHSFLVSATGCMQRSDRYCHLRCRSPSLCVLRIRCWMRGEVWLRLRRRRRSDRWVSREKSMTSGVENGFGGGGEGTGIPACNINVVGLCEAIGYDSDFALLGVCDLCYIVTVALNKRNPRLLPIQQRLLPRPNTMTKV